MIEKEIWKDVPGYENYSVSNFGRVKRKRCANQRGFMMDERMVTLQTNKWGYIKAALIKDKKVKLMSVHRLVMAAFVGECPEGLQVNHIDEDKTNNHLDNLEYVTPYQNLHHGTCLARGALKRRKGGVYQYTLDGELVNVYETLPDMKRRTGYDSSNVASVCRGKWKSAYGYTWKYGKDVV